MSGSRQRVREVAAPVVSDYIWDAATLATLRHSTLPWFESRFGTSLEATPVAMLERCGERELHSLVAQFAAHCAFLQFAGIDVGEFHDAEWAVVRKRGIDSRLVRVSAAQREAAESPLDAIEAFAARVGAPRVPTLDAAWRRPESVYIELFRMLVSDAAADFTWLRRAAVGGILSPGAENLRKLWFASAESMVRAGAEAFAALQLLATADESARLVVMDEASPVVPFSALAGFESLSTSGTVAAVAEELVSRLAAKRHVVFIADPAALDAGSRQVIEIAQGAAPGGWIYPDRGEDLPRHEVFVVAPRLKTLLSLRERLTAHPRPFEWLDEFVAGPKYETFLESGAIPHAGILSGVAEPLRSWIAALALLGPRIERAFAGRFLEQFFFTGTLEELVIEGVTTIDAEGLAFTTESVRMAAAAHIPEASRPALCRAAAALTTGITAAMLYADAGDAGEAAAILRDIPRNGDTTRIAALTRLPENELPPELARELCDALIEEARYVDARRVARKVEGVDGEFLLARIERRTGDYAAALTRLRNAGASSLAALLLEAELLRISGDHKAARERLDAAGPGDRTKPLWQFENALLAIDTGDEGASFSCCSVPYLDARLATYRALGASEFTDAARHAADAYAHARNAVERIDAALDRIFATFSAGQWEATRGAALEALAEIDESQGDRAAAGILLTLAFLAADDAQWSHAESRLKRLRTIYQAAHHERGLADVALVEAHLAFSRARFDEAESLASGVLRLDAGSPQIREAAALILDSIDWIENRLMALRSTGRSGNFELSRRHQFLDAQRRKRTDVTKALKTAASTRSQRLEVFRAAIAFGHDDVAAGLARELSLDYVANRPRTAMDVRVLRAAAIAAVPFAPTALPVPWRYAVRNRFGQWSQSGSAAPMVADELDRIAASDGVAGWTRCSERELLYLEGADGWPAESREAVAAIVALRSENSRLQKIIAQQDDQDRPGPVHSDTGAMDGFVGESPAMREVFDRIQRVASRDVVALILGESGTGKELVARAIHRQSQRKSRTFTAINCAALPENLIESELFGNVRGAFTGADRDRLGLIESSEGGTLFLDEIGEMPLAAQAKLLRFLQEGEFRRVGDSTVRTADVRIICATNRNLDEAVEAGTFREDLFYRVHGVDVTLPPLRDRGEDAVRLATYFLEAERAKHKAGPVRISDDVAAAMLSYRWPGNVRELQNTIRAAHALAGDSRELTLEHLPQRVTAAGERRVPSGAYQDAVTRFRRDLIERSITAAGGNQNRAAAMLQISRQALAYQIRELGIMVRRSNVRRERD